MCVEVRTILKKVNLICNNSVKLSSECFDVILVYIIFEMIFTVAREMSNFHLEIVIFKLVLLGQGHSQVRVPGVLEPPF